MEVYRRIAGRVRQGESYYPAAAAELAANGFPTRSVFNFRLPTLAWLFAVLPDDRAGQGVLIVLAGLTLVLAVRHVVAAGVVRDRAGGGALLLGLLAWPALDDAYLVHEVWRRPDRPESRDRRPRLVCGVARSRRGRSSSPGARAPLRVHRPGPRCESRGAGARPWPGRSRSGTFALALGAHAAAVSRLNADGGGAAGAASWLRLGGWPFVLKTAMMDAWLIAGPPVVAAIVLPLALVGLAGWRGSPGTQVAATVFGYVAAYLVVGQPFNHLWGFLYVGPALMGLALAAALRDLWRRAADATRP